MAMKSENVKKEKEKRKAAMAEKKIEAKVNGKKVEKDNKMVIKSKNVKAEKEKRKAAAMDNSNAHHRKTSSFKITPKKKKKTTDLPSNEKPTSKPKIAIKPK